jgi:hypothetical protein
LSQSITADSNVRFDILAKTITEQKKKRKEHQRLTHIAPQERMWMTFDGTLSSEMFISLNLARPDEQIFKGLSLTIPSGTTVASRISWL